MKLADAGGSGSSDDRRAVLTPIPSIESFKRHNEKPYSAPPSSFLSRWFCCSCEDSSPDLNDEVDPTSTSASSAANRATATGTAADFHASATNVSMSAHNDLQSNQRGATKTTVGSLDRVPMSELSKSSAVNTSGFAGVSSPCPSPPPRSRPLNSGAAVRQAQPNQDDKYQIAFKLPASVYSHEAASAGSDSLSLDVGAGTAAVNGNAPEPASSPISLKKFEWTLSLHEELSRNKRGPTPRPSDGVASSLIHMNRTNSRTRLSSLGTAASLPLPSESPEPSELALYVRPESSLSEADRETNTASQFLQSRQPFQPMSRSGSLSAPGGHQRVHSNDGGFVGTMQQRNSQPVLLPDRASVMEPEPITNLIDHDESIPTEKAAEEPKQQRQLQSSPISIGTDNESRSVDNSLSSETPVEYIQSRLPRPHSQNAVFHIAEDRDRWTPDRFPRSNSANCNSFNSNSLSTSSILSSDNTGSFVSSDARSPPSRLKSSQSVASTFSNAALVSLPPPQQQSSPQHQTHNPPRSNHHHHHHSSRSLGTFSHPLADVAPSLVRLHSDPVNKSTRPPSQSLTLATAVLPPTAVTAATPTPTSVPVPTNVAGTDDEDDEPRSRTHRSIGSIDFNFEMPLRPVSPSPHTPVSQTPIPPSPISNTMLPANAATIERNDLLNALTSSPFVRPSTTATTSSFASERQLSTPSSRRASFTPSLSSNLPNREYSPQLKGLELPPAAAVQLMQLREKSASALDKRSTMPHATSLSFSTLHNQQAYLVSASNSPIRGGSRILSANRSSRTQRESSLVGSNAFARSLIGVDEVAGASSTSIKQQHNDRLKRAAKRLTS